MEKCDHCDHSAECRQVEDECEGFDSAQQQESITKLEAKGFTWKHTSHDWGFQVFIKKNRTGWAQAEVDGQGGINGMPAGDYLKSL